MDLSNADLTGADFTDANLQYTKLTNANLTNVIWSNTICPDAADGVSRNSDDNGGNCDGFMDPGW